MASFRTASTTTDTSGASLFQTAYLNSSGEIISFTSGDNEVQKYYKASSNEVLYKKILKPIMLFLSSPEAGAPFTATVRNSFDGFDFTTIKTDAFSSNKFPLENGMSKNFQNAWLALSSDYADSSRNRIHRSTDGVTWSTVYGNSTLVYLSPILLEANGRRFVEADAGSGGSLANKLIRSDDGITWTEGANTIGTSARKRWVTYFDNKYIFLNNTSTVYVSSDGGDSATGYTIGADTLGNIPKVIHSYVSGGNIYFFCQYTFTNVEYGYGNDTYYRIVSRATAPSANSWTYTEVSVSPTLPFDGSDDWTSLASVNTLQISVGSDNLVCGVGGYNDNSYVVWDLSNISAGPRVESYTIPYLTEQIIYNKINGKFYISGRSNVPDLEIFEIGANSLIDVSGDFTLDAGSYENGYWGICWKE
jgi:hypothetical protein